MNKEDAFSHLGPEYWVLGDNKWHAVQDVDEDFDFITYCDITITGDGDVVSEWSRITTSNYMHCQECFLFLTREYRKEIEKKERGW